MHCMLQLLRCDITSLYHADLSNYQYYIIDYSAYCGLLNLTVCLCANVRRLSSHVCFKWTDYSATDIDFILSVLVYSGSSYFSLFHSYGVWKMGMDRTSKRQALCIVNALSLHKTMSLMTCD